MLATLMRPIVYIPSIIAVLFSWWVIANRFWWFDFWYSAWPLRLFGNIGKLKSLSHETEDFDNKVNWKSGMSRPEAALCDDYADHIKAIPTEREFNNAVDYLRLTYQSSTKPLASWKWIIVFFLTMGEAAGTGFLISPWISTEMSAHEIGYAGWIIAAVLAIVLLAITHKAGQSARKKLAINQGIGDMDPKKLVGAGKAGKIGWNHDQGEDKEESDAVRFSRRAVNGRDRGSWVLTVVAAFLLTMVLAMVFWMRWEGIRQQNTESVVQMEKHGLSGGGANPFANMAGMGGTSLPPAVQRNQAQARKVVARQIGSEELGQGFGAAALLAFLYVLTQAVGFIFSMDSAFIGEGEDAFRVTRGETAYETFERKYVSPYLRRGEARLTELRKRLVQKQQSPGATSFPEYFYSLLQTRGRRDTDMSARPMVGNEMSTYSATTNQGAAPVLTGARATAGPSGVVATQALAGQLIELGKTDKQALKAQLLKMDASEKEKLVNMMREEMERQAKAAQAADDEIDRMFGQ
jgi:hypothetical protein